MNPKVTQTVLTHLLLAVGSLVMMYPLLYGLFASFNTQADYIRSSGLLPIPTQPTFENYSIMFHPSVLKLVGASLWVTGLRIVWYTLFNGLFAILLGYVFARLRFPGKNVVFWVLLASLLVPGIVYQIPLYVMLVRWPLVGGNDILGQGGIGFLNNVMALLLPGMLNAYFVFLLRQTYLSIPVEYEEAARIEGANLVQILSYVYFPMLKPVMAVVAISTVIGNWNDYVWPLLMVNGEPSLWPTSMLFQRLMAGGLPSDVAQNIISSGTIQGVSNTPLILTFGLVATIPAVLFFFFFQRYFIEGMQGAGLKG